MIKNLYGNRNPYGLNFGEDIIPETDVVELPICQIKRNPLNDAPMTDIEELAENIKRNFLRKPITVYKEGNDYILLDGERRYTAHKHLGKISIKAFVVAKPLNEIAEREFILDANSQREDTKEYRKLRIKSYMKIYELKKAENKLPAGLRMREYIAQQMGVSDRTISRWIKDIFDKPVLTEKNDIDVQQTEEIQKAKAEKKEKDNLALKSVEHNFEERLQTQVKIDTKKITIKYNGFDDLNRILELLDMLEQPIE